MVSVLPYQTSGKMIPSRVQSPRSCKNAGATDLMIGRICKQYWTISQGYRLRHSRVRAQVHPSSLPCTAARPRRPSVPERCRSKGDLNSLPGTAPHLLGLSRADPPTTHSPSHKCRITAHRLARSSKWDPLPTALLPKPRGSARRRIGPHSRLRPKTPPERVMRMATDPMAGLGRCKSVTMLFLGGQ